MALPTTPEQKGGDNHAHVVQVACGCKHALLLTDEGIVYSWGGSNALGQLGRQAVSSDKEQEPSPITDVLYNKPQSKIKEIIVQIACGSDHCLALSQSGKLFSWGCNKAGQLGHDGFNPNATAVQLIQKTPEQVQFPEDVTVRSCSCGPESSACVSMKGEVYVWGAISYYLFGNGSKYDRHENCTVPVKVRGVPKTNLFTADQVTLHRHKFACTLSRVNASDELQNLMGTLKNRGAFYSKVARKTKQDARDNPQNGDDNLEREELRTLDQEFKDDQKSCVQKLEEMVHRLEFCRSELQRVARDLTICDQQDTALTETASSLEAKKSENTSGQAGQDDARKKALETQLSDIRYFRKSNKRTRLQLLEERDKLEQTLLHLTQDQIHYSQKKLEVEGRQKLIRSLQKGGLGKDAKSSIDDGLDIAMSKREELAATECQTLAGVGKFTGFREVVAISDRALQDVSSALKEVSGAVKGSDGVGIVDVLEANLKLRKDLKLQIQEKLNRAERGRPKDSPLDFYPGMIDFFKEGAAPKTGLS